MLEYKVNIRDLLSFELKSWIGRTFLNTKPKLKKEKNYLNLGCGSNVIDGYINADFFSSFKFWKKDIQNIEWQLDLRYPLECQDGTFDGIYTEHTLEHLYPSEVKKLLHELYRVLKSGGILRITVPDIEKYANFYIGNGEDINASKFNDEYKTGCSALRNITQNYFHVSAWDFKELKQSLEEAKFRNVIKMSFNDSNDEKLKVDIKERAWETLYVEATK